MTSSNELRRRGREALRGKWCLAIVITTFASILLHIFSLISPKTFIKMWDSLQSNFWENYWDVFRNISASSMFATRLPLQNIVADIRAVETGSLSVLEWVDIGWQMALAGACLLGISVFFLHLIRQDKDLNTTDLFTYFKNRMLFFRSLYYHVLTLTYILLWGLLLIIPGVIKSYSYALTQFILIDHPELRVSEAITRSRELMKGRKAHLFLLDLSFIGWFFLCIASFGIGFIWLAPYYNATIAEFYQEVKSRKEADEQCVIC